MRTRKSNFVTKGGLIFLAVTVLLSAYFQLKGLSAFLGLVLFFSLCAFLWAERSVAKVTAECASDDLYAFPGEEFDLPMSLENGKALLLMWLDLVLPLSAARCVGQDVAESFSWILPGQKLSWHMNVPAVSRGTAALHSVLLRSGDGFGLDETEKNVPLKRPIRLTVFPKVVPVDPSPLLRNMSEPEPAKNGILEDRTLINNIRDYADGDNFRDINWRVTARSDEITVNIHETLAMRRVCFLPDLESFRYRTVEKDPDGEHSVMRVFDDALEDAISLIASYIAALHEYDVICTLVLPSYGDHPGRIIVPEDREVQITELLSALAEIGYAGEDCVFPEAEMELEAHLLGQIYKVDQARGLLKLTGGAYEEVQ